MAVTIQDRGVVTVPAAARHALGWGKGTRLGFEVRDGALVFFEVTEHEVAVDPRWRKPERGESE